ncbi:MAG: MoaD/ThiS family protein [Anaerolineae bacterium]
MIEVRLFGHLRQRVAGSTPSTDTVVYLPAIGGETIGQVLAQIGVDPAEVGNVFVNGRLLPRSVYPMTLGYLLAAQGPLALEEYLATPVRSGDRLGIFPRTMSAVVV